MIRDIDNQTIIAQCTPRGSGAIALIRISGPDAITITDKCSQLASGKKLIDLPSHTIHYGSIVDEQGTSLDKVMFLLMEAPRTFTGQTTVEITAHNNQFVVESIIEQAIKHGARLAQNGEFSKRAFLNNKIDLVQAEAINELIHASTQKALQQSLSQLDGSFSSWITLLEKELVKNLALSEASFEFLDEEDMGFSQQIKTSIAKLLLNIKDAKKAFNQQQQIREGIRIALIGSVNAGKSSLFNTLLNKHRAIVTDIAGTTRDSIEASLYKNGNYITLVDTAGLRQTEDIVEQQGIKRSLEEAEKADIILLVADQARTMTDHEYVIYQDLLITHSRKTVFVLNKNDLAPKITQRFEHTPTISLSSNKAESIAQLEKLIDGKITHLFAQIESPFLLNQRHFNAMLNIENKLESIISMLDNPEYELISCHLKDALEQLTELTGKTISEQGMDAVFREFCVGK
jgi:tRNA modification GTPase